MRPVCLLDRTKNLHQSDGLHFISDFLKNGIAAQNFRAAVPFSYANSEKEIPKRFCCLSFFFVR